MSIVISRIIRFGVQNFWRYGFASAATVAVMVLSLLMFIGLVLFHATTGAAVSSIADKIDISVYFKTTTPDEQITSIRDSVANLPEVARVDYISKDQALEIFKEQHKDDPTISQAINELTSNPLQAHLNIKANDPSQYQQIATYFRDSETIAQYVESVSYYENQVVIDRLNAIIANVNRGGFALIIFLALVAALVTLNTIWLAIYSNREEITIMRLVGASNALVRGPFIVVGIIAGVVAGIVSFIITVPIVHVINPYLHAFLPTFSLTSYFYRNAFFIITSQIAFGVALGTFSSYFAVRRYLKR